MNRNNKLILLPILILSCFFCLGLSTAVKKPIKLAAFFNVSGGMTSVDNPGLKGARLAAGLINERGGLLDGRMLEISVYDTKTNLKSVAAQAQQAVSVGAVAGLGYADSTYALAAAPTFHKAGVPFVTSGATLPQLPALVGDHLFMVAFGDDAQARAMAEFAYKTLKAKKIVIWTNSTTDFTKALSSYFREYFSKLGGGIIYEESFTAEKKDYSILINRLNKQTPTPEAIFISATPDEAGSTVKQIREAGVRLPILSGDGFDTELIISEPGPALADEIYFSTHFFQGDNRSEVRNFIGAYKKAYNIEPENAFAALGFDAVNLIAHAIQKAGTDDRKILVQTISQTKGFNAVTGEISYLSPKSPPQKPVVIMAVKKGRLRSIEVWRPIKK